MNTQTIKPTIKQLKTPILYLKIKYQEPTSTSGSALKLYTKQHHQERYKAIKTIPRDYSIDYHQQEFNLIFSYLLENEILFNDVIKISETGNSTEFIVILSTISTTFNHNDMHRHSRHSIYQIQLIKIRTKY